VRYRGQAGDLHSPRRQRRSSHAQLGDTATTAARSLTTVTAGTFSNATAIAAALLHTCAIVPPGSVFCWGANFNGSLGNTTVVASSSAMAVYVTGLAGVTAISGGSYHTCLGNGSINNSTMPVPVTGW
jgi:alpha-tubulin suppressor-like RCC1 family protein